MISALKTETGTVQKPGDIRFWRKGYHMEKFVQAEKKRIICLDQKADARFWDEKWIEDFELKEKDLFYAEEMVMVTNRFISPCPENRIIEGGCGKGRVVMALNRAGYNVTGVDYAQKTVDKLNEIYPGLKIFPGDVRMLSGFSDSYFAGYWSLGIIEHFWHGYEDILKEAFRVIKDGGYLFLTFPWFSPLRRTKIFLKVIPSCMHRETLEPADFYQFMLNEKQVCKILRKCGFKIVETIPRSGIEGLISETSLFRSKRFFPLKKDGKTTPTQSGLFQKKGYKKMLRKADQFLAPFFGHSYMIVAQKV